MKLQINLKYEPNAKLNSTIGICVGCADTVSGLKDRVALAQPIPFPEQKVVLNGVVLEDGQRLADCGVLDGASLDLVVKATESSFVKQLSELLQARNLSCDELGLMYSYKRGASINQVFDIIGFDGKLPDFLEKQKTFSVANSRVALVREETKPPWRQQVGLACGADIVDRPRMLAPPGLEAPIAPPGLDTGDVDNQRFLDLHNRISGRAFNSGVSQALGNIVDAVSDKLCLRVDHVIRGGSVGKGTVIVGGADSEVVFFSQGLPPKCHERWLPLLLKAVAGVLGQQLQGEHGVENIEATEDSVQMRVKGLGVVNLRFSPVFATHAAVIEAMGSQGPDARHFYSASLMRERVQFIARQPGQVKVTIRLVKWWRDQQDWSSNFLKPTDEILELAVVYSAARTKAANQSMAITNVMSLLSRFDDLRIVWSNYYSRKDVWTPLLRQRPLLMDPVNPFVNVADPRVFDGRELMEFAKTTHFFW